MAEILSLPLPHIASQFMLRQDIAFLNHGSFGACPQPVFDVYQAWQRELERQPVDFLGRRLQDLLKEARAKLGAFINAAGDDLVFVPNATYGVNIVARSLRLEPGDEVLSTDHEYGAVNKAWRFNCERQGASFINHPMPLPVADREAWVERFWEGVTPRTRVIAMSHITSPTALRLPIEAICRRAREAGILTVIDGAHAPGQVDLDMQAIGADFYAGNCHKWLCSPKGAAFLFARPETQSLLDPLVVSHGWRSDHPGASVFLDTFSWVGTDDPAAYLSVPAAIEFQQGHNWPAVRDACHRLGVEARRRIQELGAMPPIAPESQEWWGQMFVAPLPPCDIKRVREGLWEDFCVEVPVFEYQDWRFVRVSIQAYTTPEHIDRLVEGLRCLVDGG